MNKFISLQSFYQFNYVQDCAQLYFDKLHEISLRHFAAFCNFTITGAMRINFKDKQ